jgi:hypothetical protein
MARHTLITGETGSGKTKSGIFPLVEAALRYPGPDGPPGLTPAILVIDPKHEIADFVARACERAGLDRTVIHFDPDADAHTLWYFEGSDPATVTADEYVRRVLASSGALESATEDANSGFFRHQAEGTLRQLVAVDLRVARTHGYAALHTFWEAVRAFVRRELGALTDGAIQFDAANYLAAHYALTNNAAATANYTGLSKRPGSAVLLGYLGAAEQFGVPASLLIGIRSMATLPWETFTSVIATVNNVLGEMSSPDLARHVSLNPFVPPPAARWLSVAAALDAGHVVIHHPRDERRAELPRPLPRLPGGVRPGDAVGRLARVRARPRPERQQRGGRLGARDSVQQHRQQAVLPKHGPAHAGAAARAAARLTIAGKAARHRGAAGVYAAGRGSLFPPQHRGMGAAPRDAPGLADARAAPCRRSSSTGPPPKNWWVKG